MITTSGAWNFRWDCVGRMRHKAHIGSRVGLYLHQQRLPGFMVAKILTFDTSIASLHPGGRNACPAFIHPLDAHHCWCCMKLKNTAWVHCVRAACSTATAASSAVSVKCLNNCTNKSDMVPRVAMPHPINHGAPQIPPTFMGCETASMATTLDNLLKSTWAHSSQLKALCDCVDLQCQCHLTKSNNLRLFVSMSCHCKRNITAVTK